MMTWEETVLTKEQMAEINANMPPEAKYEEVFLEISKATAKVAFEAGYNKCEDEWQELYNEHN